MRDTISRYSPDILKHYGVLGMKWGVRRYQNKDGSLTAEGRRRMGFNEKRLRKSALAASRDAADLRAKGYKKEAKAVQKVADKNLKKANKIADKSRRKQEDKLNKEMTRQRLRETQYAINEKASFQNAQTYARRYSSGSAASQRRYIKQGQKKCSKILAKTQNDYIVVYDVTTGRYILREKD